MLLQDNVMVKKIKITESDLYNIIKQVLLEQEEEENIWYTDAEEFEFRLFKAFDGISEKFAKYHNKYYDKIVVDGSLDLRRTQITSLPDNLHVGGDLNLVGCKNLTSLPDNLSVEGYLDLYGTPITSLPDNLHVGGNLDLSETPITSLPDNLHVGGNLYLSETPITSLGDNLSVGGYLDLEGTQITSLPDNLSVEGNLFLQETPIEYLPDNLVVKGYIYIYRTPLNDNDELVKEYMAKGYKFHRES